jgi:hypothetical protein
MGAPEEIRRRFAEGVDLYFAKRYSEALVIFNNLAAAMPHDADIQMGQTMCLNALRKISPMGRLAHDGAFGRLAVTGDSHDREETVLHGPTPTLDRDFFKRFFYDKMMHGDTDDVQVRAAELAAKMLGFLDGAQPDESVAEQDGPEVEIVDDEETTYNIPRPTPFRRVAPDDSDR